ncbi:MAG TPA: TetR family transcriptional regulator [Polyangiaceae bacterium]|nr:TetR family transcriptional regulator [Polyangiaceae bacterium]
MVRDAHPTGPSAGVVPGAEPDPVEDNGPAPPADRIMAAALTCMERDGIEATGIRDIAREAGVNSAAINYYFRSKDNLIRLALERSLENAFDGTIGELDRLLAESVPMRVAFERVMDDYLHHLGEFPRLAYAHLRDALVNQRYDGDAIVRLNAFLDQLLARLARGTSSERAAELRLLLVQVWGSLLLFGVLPRLLDPFLSLDFSQAEVRERYLRRLLAGVHAWLEEG